MSEERQHTIKVVVANETLSFRIDASEETSFRKAAFSVNEMWSKMCAAQPSKSSHYALAKVAMAFAGLCYNKNQQLEAQSKLLNDLEHNLDELILKMES